MIGGRQIYANSEENREGDESAKSRNDKQLFLASRPRQWDLHGQYKGQSRKSTYYCSKQHHRHWRKAEDCDFRSNRRSAP